MFVYFLVILTIVYLRINVGVSTNDRIVQRYSIIVCLLFVLLASLRWIIPETDVEAYMFDYERMASYSFGDIFKQWDGNYITYYCLCKLFKLIGLPYRFWLGFVQIVSISGFIKLVNRYSSDKILSLLLYFTVGLFSFSINGLKQALAMGLVWYALSFISDKKYLYAVIFSVLAFFAHKTSAFFMLSFVMFFMKGMRRIYMIIIVIMTIAVAIIPSQILNFLTASLGEERYGNYLGSEGGYSYVTFIFYLMLFFIGFISKNKKDLSNISGLSQFVSSLAIIAVVANLFAQISATSFRLALYYTPFLAFYVSNKVQDKNVRLFVMVFTAFFFLYTSRSLPYKFFWQ